MRTGPRAPLTGMIRRGRWRGPARPVATTSKTRRRCGTAEAWILATRRRGRHPAGTEGDDPADLVGHLEHPGDRWRDHRVDPHVARGPADRRALRVRRRALAGVPGEVEPVHHPGAGPVP